jgi:hypothetical protein
VNARQLREYRLRRKVKRSGYVLGRHPKLNPSLHRDGYRIEDREGNVVAGDGYSLDLDGVARWLEEQWAG